MNDLVVVDYGAGNIRSLCNALRYIGVNPVLSSDPKFIETAERIILPGVGSFPYCIGQLEALGLTDVLKNILNSGVPLLGICVGMQMLFDKSFEHGGAKGLGLIAGDVVHLSSLSKQEQRYPHVNWSRAEFNQCVDSSHIFKQPLRDEHFYFVHSYACVPAGVEPFARSVYGDVEFCSAVLQKNLCGVQFHPEKSGPAGLALLRDFSLS